MAAVDQLENALKASVSALRSKVQALQLLAFVKVRLDSYLKKQTLHLVRLLQDEERTGVVRRHLTKMQMIRLGAAAHKHKQLILAFVKELRSQLPVQCRSLTINTFDQFFVDSDQFELALQPLMLRIES